MKQYFVTIGNSSVTVSADDEVEAIRLARLQIPDRCGSNNPIVNEVLVPQETIAEVASALDEAEVVEDVEAADEVEPNTQRKSKRSSGHR